MAAKLWLALLSLVLALSPVGAMAHDGQHGPEVGHVVGAGAWGNSELLGVAWLTTTPGLVADVAVSPKGRSALLASWIFRDTMAGR
jgi:hypothetical protein